MHNFKKADAVVKAFQQGATTNKEAAALAGCSVSYVQQCTISHPEVYKAKQEAKKKKQENLDESTER